MWFDDVDLKLNHFRTGSDAAGVAPSRRAVALREYLERQRDQRDGAAIAIKREEGINERKSSIGWLRLWRRALRGLGPDHMVGGLLLPRLRAR